jgi:uncharacterized MAPEG superfamily protein
MTTPFWCILVAALLPYVWSSAGVKARVDQFGALDNRHPRAQQAQLEGWGARALGASANGFETLPFFIAAVLIAHLCGADPGWSATWSLVYVASRVAHGLLYVGDLDKLRSLAFGVGQAASVALFVLAARAV